MDGTDSFVEALGTVNPADLQIPNNEQLIPENFDIDLLCTDPGIVIPTEPIYINAPPTNNVMEQPEQHLPYTGWEQMTPNGDINYSSYGSSPADNSLELQLMVQRFGHYNINMGRGGNFEKPGLSRNASFSSFEQYPHSPAGEAWQQRYPARATRRGRLLADMTSPGPETVFEDSDSHHSWTAADNVETWCSHLRERLAEFRKNKQRVSIITSPLQTRQRRKVHSMANLLGLSHTSLGTGRQKRVLICKCELTRSRAQMIEKRWNPSRNNWSHGLVDPRVVLFDLVSPKLSPQRLLECLVEAGLPIPLRLTIDCFSPMKPGIVQPVATAYAMFNNTDDAAYVLLALDGTKPNWNGLDVELECDYVHFPPGFDLSDAALDNFDRIPDAVRMEKLRMQEGKVFSSFRASNTNSVLYSDTESDDEPASSRGLRSRGTSNESWYSRDAGYVSANSPMHSDYSSRSHASSSKKRKRVPKISGGYCCTFQGCDRVFDRDGDRRKHEKNHGGERPHVCHKCGKGFLFPKDLRRHMIVHSITSLPSSNEGEGERVEEGGNVMASNGGAGDRGGRAKQIARAQPLSTSPPLSEDHLKRLYGEVRPRDRRISRISSFGK